MNRVTVSVKEGGDCVDLITRKEGGGMCTMTDLIRLSIGSTSYQVD